MNNYILSYYQQIKNGSVVTGKWVRLLYEYIIEGLEQKTFFFEQKKANDAIEWIESHCFHTEGPLAPGPFILELWQKALVSCIFGIVDKDGLRQFREILLIVARKNGKSLLAAAIARYEWIIDGGYGAKVYTVAPKLDQADIIYLNIWQMTILDPDYKKAQAVLDELRGQRVGSNGNHAKRQVDELPRHRQSDLYLAINNGTVKKIAFAAKRSDGFNPSLCICDEIASWEGDKGLKQYEVMKSGMGARPEGILLSCSTAGYVNDSIFDELMKRSTRFLLGDSKEKKLLPFIYMIDDTEKWNDINELRKSNPNLGVSVSVDYMLEEIAVAEGSMSKKAEFMTKYANVKQNSSQAWLDVQVVEQASGKPLRLEDYKGCYAVCGIDLSQTTDLTALTCIIEKDGILNVFGHAWLPSEKIEEATQRDGVPYQIYIQRGFLSTSGENFIDYNDVYDWMIRLVREYEIYPLMTGYDRYSSQYLVKALESDGYRLDSVYQGDNLWGTMQNLEGLLKDKKINIGDNDLLKSHLLNSAVKMSVERGRGRLVKINQYAHIDLTAALLDALVVREKWCNEIGEQLKNED